MFTFAIFKDGKLQSYIKIDPVKYPHLVPPVEMLQGIMKGIKNAKNVLS